MLTLTPAAAREIQAAALRSGLPEDDWALRIAADVDAEGAIRFGLGFDEEREADLSFTDHVVDLAQEGLDVAIRWGELPSSDMVARLLGRTRQVIVGAPDYLLHQGRPRHPDDLQRHLRLGWNYQRTIPYWPFDVKGQRVEVGIGEVVRVNDGDVMRQLVLQGVGLARLSLFHAWDDLVAGRLEVVLEDFNTGVLEPIHAVYLGKPDRLPPRTRAVLDFLQAQVDLRYAEHWPGPQGA